MFIAEGASAATAVTTGGTFVKVAGTTTAGHLEGFTHANGRLTYNGPKRWFTVQASATVSVDLSGGIVHLQFYKSGALLPDSEQHRKVSTANDKGNMGCSTMVELEAGDYLELWTTTDVGQDGKNVTAEHVSITVS
jgi:hypothetical protein